MTQKLIIKKTKDGWEAIIYENKVKVAKINGSQLIQVANEGFRYFIQYLEEVD